MGPGAADNAALLPELHEKLTGLKQPPQRDPEQSRFRLFDSIATFLKNASVSSPLLMILEDLHWSDHSSLMLWEFVAKEISDSKMMFLGTYREVEAGRSDPLSQTLGGLIREPNFHRVHLNDLSQQDVGRFVELNAGVVLTEQDLESVRRRTEGNPLFLNQLVRLLGDDGEEAIHSWTTALPKGIRDVIGRRLSRLSERCNDVLTVASAIGSEFTEEQLKSVVELTLDKVGEALDEAWSALIIAETPHVIGRLQFTHSMILETLTAELSTNPRIRLHARIAEALERIYAGDEANRAAELGRHFFEAQSVLGVDKLARFSLMAGERAMASHAYEDALAHFERGLVARNITLSGTEAASDAESAALLFGLARSQTSILERHQLWETFATLSRAFEYYAKAGNVALAVTAAEFPIAPTPFRIPDVAELLVRALTLVQPDSHEAGRLLSRYGGIRGAAYDYEGAQEALGRAIAIARNEGDVLLEVRTLTYAAVVSGLHLRWQESVDNGLRAIDLSTGGEIPWSELLSRCWTAFSLLYMGDLDAARPPLWYCETWRTGEAPPPAAC